MQLTSSSFRSRCTTRCILSTHLPRLRAYCAQAGRIAVLDLAKHRFEEAREMYADEWLGFSEADLETMLQKAGFAKVQTSVVYKEARPAPLPDTACSGPQGKLTYTGQPMADQTFRRVPEPTSAPGDFYVDSYCCTACGVPQAAAPDLVGWTDEKSPQCRWKKQPSTPAEFTQAFAIFDGQELGCHRYAGSDPEIQQRVGIENCDLPLNAPKQLEPISPSSADETAETKRRAPVWSKKWHRMR